MSSSRYLRLLSEVVAFALMVRQDVLLIFRYGFDLFSFKGFNLVISAEEWDFPHLFSCVVRWWSFFDRIADLCAQLRG